VATLNLEDTFMSTRQEALFKALSEDLGKALPRLRRDGLFDPDGYFEWGPDCSPEEVAAILLWKNLTRKLLPIGGRTTMEGDTAATVKFLDTNKRCKDWTFSPNTSLDEELMGDFCSLLYQFWYFKDEPLVSSFSDILSKGRTGPGSSVGVLGEDFYTKLFSSPMTVTKQSLYDAYEHHLAHDGRQSWAAGEFIRKRFFDTMLVEGSRLTFVPKDEKVSRLIAVEPSLNMFYQLGFGALLEERLRSFFGLDLPFQPWHNQDAARIGSLDDSLVTLDLSEASDSLAMPMLKWALPPSFLGWLELLRSPKATLSGEALELNMVSTMGNGFTFPLETLIFSCIVIAALRSHGIKPTRPNRALVAEFQSVPEREGWWGVFGDDIFCHRKVSARVERLLHLLGFKVNSDKSFVEGPFRESCGRDFFKGHEVRSVYLKDLSTAEARYAAINNLNVWSAKTGIFLPRTVQAVAAMGLGHQLMVPPAENSDAGLRVPFSFIRGQGVFNRNKSVIITDELRHPRFYALGMGTLAYQQR
jgi:hypothetical protein